MNIFLSYDQADQDVARDLASCLSQLGHEVWYAGGCTFPGDNVPLMTGKALNSSDAMVVLVSRKSMQSSWVRSEISFALGSPRFAGRLIPVIIEPSDELPGILRRLGTVEAARDIAETSRRVAARLEQATRPAHTKKGRSSVR